MPHGEAAVGTVRRLKVEAVALNVQKLLGKFASAFGGIGLSVLLGFDPLPSLRPLQTLLANDWIGVIILVVVISVIAVGSFLITRKKKPDHKPVKNPLLHALRVLGESLAEIVVGFLAGLLLGISSAPSTIPLLGILRAHPPIGIALGAVLLLILILAPLLGGAEEETDEEHGADRKAASATSLFARPGARLWFASATSFTSLALLLTLFGMITIRPAWCPTSICPAPQLIVVTNRNGVNDGVLESFYLAQQSATYALTQAPTAYTFNNLPNSVGAVELGATPSPYRAVIGIHSLQRDTRYGLIIDGVDVIIDKATSIQGPVNVFLQGTNLSYNHQLFTFTYFDETAPTTLPAKAPSAVIGLEVGGSDELAVQVTALGEVSLQFHLRVRYHQIVGGPLSRTLVIPHEFAVDFIAPAHWKPFVFSGGKMIPQP